MAPEGLTPHATRLSTNTTHCHGSSLPSMEAKLPAAWISHGKPPTGHLPTDPKERPPPVIVAKLNHRRAAPTSSREPMPRNEAAAIIQMRRLQEGSDADGATVARPKWTGFSPLDDMLEGKTRRPQQGSGAQWRRRRQGFRPRIL